MSRLTPGHGAPLDDELRPSREPSPLAIDEGEIAAECNTSTTIKGRPAVLVWLSSGAKFLWARTAGFKGM
jgi:hypothetical protein